jgi:hypothetical protein
MVRLKSGSLTQCSCGPINLRQIERVSTWSDSPGRECLQGARGIGACFLD